MKQSRSLFISGLGKHARTITVTEQSKDVPERNIEP